MTRHARLYTEMLVADAVIYGDRRRLLRFSAAEHPVALQLGGSDPEKLAQAAAIGEDTGFAEINLNVGCPSDRVQSGAFGACLMAEPERVAGCVVAMRAACSLPVTVKCRIGIDDQDEDADLDRFVETVADAGCSVFIVHARKAWLEGLSPKQNRDVPPLNHARVWRLKQSRADLTIVLNGGLETLDACESHLAHVDGVMMGRAAYHTPYTLADVDQRLFKAKHPVSSREEIVQRLIPYAVAHIEDGGRLNNITRHILGLYHGQPRGRLFRRHLSENAIRDGATVRVLEQALEIVAPSAKHAA